MAKDGETCQAVGSDGKVSEVDCDEALPGLCTQSAPVSTSETNDDPTDYHIDHAVGDHVYTGFRDHFVFKFRGIRFAEQPLRFEYATLYEPNDTEPIPALKAGADCLQPIGEVEEGMSEDCLFLNVWTPTLPPSEGVPKDKLKPVMFYIYGGALTSGSGKNSNTDGTNLASRGDVVSISFNYRVSTLGFLVLNDGLHNGNYAFSDVVTALEWVRKNVESFGGDPERVTIFGESAGAAIVRALLASPKAQGLFSGAISQSGPAGLFMDSEHGYGAYYNSLEYGYEHETLPILNETGCADVEDALECLRQFNGTELVNLNAIAASGVQDGVYLPVSHLPLNGSGVASDVVFMTGINRDELGVDVEPFPNNATVDDALTFLGKAFGADAASILETGLFPLPEEPTSEDLVKWVVRVATDGMYTCMEAATNHAAAKNGVFKDLYAFEFNRTFNPRGYTQPHCDAPATDEFPEGDARREYLKCHAGEQMFVFGTVLRAGLPDRDGLDVAFMQLIVDYWSAFAWKRNPNPDEGYLKARGYHGTLAQVESVGEWRAASGEEANLRSLEWDGGHVELRELEQCEALGIPLDFWLSRENP